MRPRPRPRLRRRRRRRRAHFADRARVVVLGLAAAGLDPAAQRAADAALLFEARRDAHIDVVGPADAGAVIDAAALEKARSCEEVACVKPAASAFGAHQVLTAALHEGQLTMTLLDVVNDKVRNRVVRAAKGNLDAAVRSSTAAVYGVAGHLRLSEQPAGAEVLVDGVPAGLAPVADIAVEKPGPHVVSVRGAGLVPFEETVEVRGGADVDVIVRSASVASLEDEQVWWRIGAGALGAAGVVAAGGAGAFYASALASDQRLDSVGRKASQAQLDAITSETAADVTTAVILGAASAVLLGGGAAAWFLNPATTSLP